MAETILEVVIRARNEMAATLTDIKKQVDALASSLNKPQAPITVPGAEKATTDLLGLMKQSQASIESVGKLAGTVQTLGKAFLALEVVKFVSSLAEAAAKENMMVASLHAVADSVGIARFRVDSITTSMKEMGYSTEGATTAITKFIRAGLPIDSMEALAKGARDLALVAGTDLDSALNRIIFSIQNLTSRSLRQLGVNVDLATATRAYAQANGVATASLDRHTQSIAFMNAVQIELNRYAAAGAVLQTELARQMQVLTVQTGEAKTALGQGLIPIFQLFVEEGIKFMKNIQLMQEGTDGLSVGAKNLADDLRPVLDVIRSIAEFIVKHIQAVLLVVAAYGTLRLAIGAVTSTLEMLTTVGLGNLAKMLSAFATGPVGLAIMALAALSAGAVYAGVQMNTAAEKAQAADKLLGNTSGIDKIKEAFIKFGIAVVTSPIGAGGSMFGRIAQAAKTAWDEITGIGEATAKTVELLGGVAPSYQGWVKKEEELQQAVLARTAAEMKVGEAIKSGTDEQEIAARVAEGAATAAVEAAQKRVTAYQDIMEKQHGVDEGVREGVVAMATWELANAKATEAERLNNIELEKTATSLKVTSDAVRRGLDISDAFTNMASGFKILMENFDAGLKNAQGGLKVTAGEVDNVAKRIVEAAKTPDEISAAIHLIGLAAHVSADEANKLRQVLMDKMPAAILKAAADATKGFSDALKELNDLTKFSRDLDADWAKVQNDLQSEMLKAGYSVQAAANGVLDYGKAFATTTQTIAAGVQVQIDGYKKVEEVAKAALTSGLADIQLKADAEKKAINDAFALKVKTEQDTARAENRAALDMSSFYKQQAIGLKAVDEGITKDSLAMWKTYYDSLRKEVDSRLKDVMASTAIIKGLEDELAKSQQSRTDALTKIRQVGMTEEQKDYDNLRIASEAFAKAETARLAGNTDLAKKFNADAIAANDKITVTEKNKNDVAENTVALYDEQDKILGDAATNAKKNRDIQVAGLNDQLTLLTSIKQVIEGLAAKEAVDIKVKMHADQDALNNLNQEIQSSVDGLTLKKIDAGPAIVNLGKQLGDVTNSLTLDIKPAELQAFREKIQKALTDIQVTLLVKTAQGQAAGGPIHGPGGPTSDSVPIWASAGEYMIRAASVAHYGAGFMDLINQMRLPRPAFAGGGMIAANDPGGSGGRDVVDVNLSVGGQKVSLMGERQQVRKLVGAFKNLEGM